MKKNPFFKVEEVVETSSDTVAKPAPRRTRSKK